MSSDEAEPSVHQRKRELLRACDVCRKKKVKCDGPLKGNRNLKCTYCTTHDLTCRYQESSQPKLGPSRSYASSLEARLQKVEALLLELRPDYDFSQELGFPVARGPFSLVNRERATAASPSSSVSRLTQTSSSSFTSAVPPSRQPLPEPDAAGTANDVIASSDEELPGSWLNGRFTWLQRNPAAPRFVGKAAEVRLVRRAIETRNAAVPPAEHVSPSDIIRGTFTRRPQIWHVHPWENHVVESFASAAKHHSFTFPSPDLLGKLVEAFFIHVNVLYPLLHRPTFARWLEAGLHARDDDLGSIVLLLCAVAARFIDDVRVLDGTALASAGWKYYAQVATVRTALHPAPSLADLQRACLSALFLAGSSAPQTAWQVAGAALRDAQDLGLHRRRAYSTAPSAREEPWKRAFWILLHLDRTLSAQWGRACAMQDEDFDVNFPCECDDDYWEPSDSAGAFQQPRAQPSTIAFFISLLKLDQVLAFALRTIYTLDRSKHLLGYVGEAWEQRIATKLDAALDTWVAGVPEHLRWDPLRESDVFFAQSATLHAAYHHLRILVHRPFLRRSRLSVALSPAAAACTAAARACGDILAVQHARDPTPQPAQINVAMAVGVMELLDIWTARRDGIETDALAMSGVQACMDVIKRCETRWHVAGRLWNHLAEMASNSTMQPGEIWDAQTDATGAAYGIGAMARSLVSDATVIRPPAPYPTVSDLVPPGAGADAHPSTTQSPPASELPMNTAIDNWWMDTDAPARHGAEGAHLGRHGVLPGEDTLATWQQAPFAFGSEDWAHFLHGFAATPAQAPAKRNAV